ncbi:MAG: Imm8 family immunity protein [Neisseria sp.]|nr:Imm8 family immunity protein [Neisseria sp.]
MDKIRTLILKQVSCDEVNIRKLKHLDNQDIYHRITLEISSSNYIGKTEQGINFFYFTLTTPEALLKKPKINYLLVKNRTIVIRDFNYEKFISEIKQIVSNCYRPTWEESVAELLKYFEWEYENYA